MDSAGAPASRAAGLADDQAGGQIDMPRQRSLALDPIDQQAPRAQPEILARLGHGQTFVGWSMALGRRWRIDCAIQEVDAERHQILFRMSLPFEARGRRTRAGGGGQEGEKEAIVDVRAEQVAAPDRCSAVRATVFRRLHRPAPALALE
jgi:hypothetical protein